MKILTILGAIVGVLFLSAINIVLSGYVISVLWLWFVVSTFNIAALSVAQAIGLALVVSYLTHQNQEENTEGSPSEKLIKHFLTSVFRAVFALGIGWIVTLFM